MVNSSAKTGVITLKQNLVGDLEMVPGKIKTDKMSADFSDDAKNVKLAKTASVYYATRRHLKSYNNK